MTTDLEKQFFDTFEIKPKYTYLITDTFYTNNSHTYEATKNDLIDYFEGKNCGRYKVIKIYKTYPQITDRHYLELICVYNRYDSPFISGASKIENLKMHILNSLIIIFEDKNTDELKHQVQKLFKGE